METCASLLHPAPRTATSEEWKAQARRSPSQWIRRSSKSGRQAPSKTCQDEKWDPKHLFWVWHGGSMILFKKDREDKSTLECKLKQSRSKCQARRRRSCQHFPEWEGAPPWQQLEWKQEGQLCKGITHSHTPWGQRVLLLWGKADANPLLRSCSGKAPRGH